MALSEKRIEEWDIDRLIEYKNNAKIHTPEQIKRIAKSIEKNGLINMPNVEPDGSIISGHGRKAGLKLLGRKTVPVVVRYDLTKAQAAAARLSDNKVSEGSYDTNMIQEELRWLESEDIGDLTDIGFDERELAFLTEDIGQIDMALLDDQSTLDTHLADHEGETYEEISRAEQSTVKLAKVIGFNEVTVAQSRVISRFITTVCEQMDEPDPAAALTAFASGVMQDD
ncbi:ParB/Srx family N-terminal domain-containing protein [Shewanella glacialipiscicola]|uniref:ParB/Srx family N-terminal domain-containing protein n=1 Tax=Shewanella glacialipiscicola TaxID=614069 RepID=UPI003D7B4EFE